MTSEFVHVDSRQRYSSLMARALQLLFISLFVFSATAATSPLKSDAKIVVLVFVSSECPISNKFIPELERISRKCATNGVSFTLVYPNASDTEEKIAEHRRDFKITAAYTRDAKHQLMKRANATITPEAVVFNETRNIVYQGRVNDQYIALGKGRPEATQHDLEEAIDSLVGGWLPRPSKTEPIGCYIQD